MKPVELKNFVQKSLSDSKAIDVVTIDLKGKTEIADFMIVASGTSSRHVVSIAETVMEKLRSQGIRPLGVEGTETGEWVLVDLFDVIVHIFQPEIREKYEMEKMWDFQCEKKEKKADKKDKKPKAKKADAKKTPSKKPAAKKSAATKSTPAKKRVIKK